MGQIKSTSNIRQFAMSLSLPFSLAYTFIDHLCRLFPPPSQSHVKMYHHAFEVFNSFKRFSNLMFHPIREFTQPNIQLGQPVQSAQQEHSELSELSGQLSEEEKFKMRETLYYLFCDVEDLSFSALDKEALARLHIRVEALPTTETTAVGQSINNTPGPAEFFEPISEEEIRSYPFGPEDEDVQMDISSLPKFLEDIARCNGGGSADFLCYMVAQFFCACRSSLPKTELGTQSLKRVRGWRYSE